MCNTHVLHMQYMYKIYSCITHAVIHIEYIPFSYILSFHINIIQGCYTNCLKNYENISLN